MDYRKKFLLTVGLRAAAGLVAFGGFCAIFAPLAALNVIAITLIGMLYAVGFGQPRLRTNQMLLIVVLALVVHGQVAYPALLWIIAPMAATALGCGLLMPYPERKTGRQDGKPDDVRALSSPEAQGRRPGDA